MKHSANIADRRRQRLTDQRISMDGPGSILRDIETLIAFIGVDGRPTGSKQGNLPAAVLPELNERLTQPIALNLKRPLLRDYPNIAGPYVLLRVMDLARAAGKRLWINPEALALWQSLNPAEKYFALLEAWLFEAESEVLGASDRGTQSQFSDNLRFLTNLKTTQWKTFHEFCHVYGFLGAVSTWNTQLQIRLGLIEVQPRSLERGPRAHRGWIMEKARRTPWGEAVAWALLDSIRAEDEDEDEDLIMFYPPEDGGFGFLQPAFQPSFPDWRKVYKPPRTDSGSGVYVFKVRMDDFRAGGPVWRRLAVPAPVSLDELAGAILDAFEFSDRDHLYEFRYRDRLGRGRVYNHPYTDEGPYATEIAMGDTGLPDKGVMAFQFDYGDNWLFELRLERIDPSDNKISRPVVTDSAGRPPKQYPDWEE